MGCPLALFLVLLPLPLQERCRVMIKRASWLFFNQYYLSLKAGARGSPVNVSFGQESPGTKQGTTTLISRNWFNPFAPEPPVTASADPGPFHPL